MKWNILSNPFLKTAASQVAGLLTGVVANSIDTIIQNPTGGTAAFLQAHPLATVGYVAGSTLVHNLISHALPPGPTAAPEPAASKVTPQP